MVEDLERRIGALFDALNCEMLSKPVVDQLLELTRGGWMIPTAFRGCMDLTLLASYGSTRARSSTFHSR